MSFLGLFLTISMGLLALVPVALVVFSTWLVLSHWEALGAEAIPGLLPLQNVLGKQAEALRLRHQVRLWYLPTFHPNGAAFRDWKGNIHCVVTSGTLRALDENELESFLLALVCLGRKRSRWLLPILVVFLFLERRSGRGPWLGQKVSELLIVSMHRIFVSGAAHLKSEAEVKAYSGGRTLAGAMQKISVLGKKIPWEKATLSLDPLFFVPSFGSSWGILMQSDLRPSVEARRLALLSGPSCESRGPLS